MGDLYKDMPRNLAPQGLFYRMLEKHQMGDIFYLDLWPTSKSPIEKQIIRSASE